jgi:hypothetical protein
MKWAALLNNSPSSSKKTRALTPQWTIKNKTRKIPVNPITSFFPIVELNAFVNQFILIYKSFKNYILQNTKISVIFMTG